MYVIKFTFNRNTPDDISAPQIELKVSYQCFLSCFEGWEKSRSEKLIRKFLIKWSVKYPLIMRGNRMSNLLEAQKFQNNVKHYGKTGTG